MNGLAVLVLALAALTVEGRPHATDVEFECNGQPDGYYADLSDRAAFFSCYEGSLVAKVVCEEGFEFDGQENCVPVQDNVETSELEEKEVTDNLPNFSGLNLIGEGADEDGTDEYGQFRNETSQPKFVLNLEITKNIFPRSLIIIGRMNREQKNK